MRPDTFTAAPAQRGMHGLTGRESPSPSQTDPQLAEAALESTRQAIARWSGGIHLPQTLAAGKVRVSPQARWYAAANDGFQDWLAQGGFAQTLDGCHHHPQHSSAACAE